MSDVRISNAASPAAPIAGRDLRDMLFSGLAAILKIPQAEIDPDRPFDEYGLDSIDAVIATSTLSDRLGLDLAPELLLQYRTPAELYRKLSETAGAGDAPTSGDRIFLFNGGAGRDGRLSRLASWCPPTAPFQFVTYGRWQDWVEQGFTFDDLAAHVYAQVKEQAPTGAIRLAGYSQGGQLAFVVALLCLAEGRELDVLTILDSDCQCMPVPSPGLRKDIGWIKRTTERLLKSFTHKVLARLKLRTADADTYRSGDARIAALVEWYWLGRSIRGGHKTLAWLARAAPFLFSGRGGMRFDNTIQMQIFQDNWQEWLRAAENRPKYAGPVVLFRSEEPGPKDFGWGERCADISIFNVVGGHHAMLDRVNLDGIGPLFRQVLKL